MQIKRNQEGGSLLKKAITGSIATLLGSYILLQPTPAFAFIGYYASGDFLSAPHFGPYATNGGASAALRQSIQELEEEISRLEAISGGVEEAGAQEVY